MLKIVILSKRNSQMGNRLTMHAHLLACCLEKGCTFLNPTLGGYADFFSCTRGRLLLQKDLSVDRTPTPRWISSFIYFCVRVLYQMSKISRLLPRCPIQSRKATRNPEGTGLMEFLDQVEAKGGRLALVQTWKIREYNLCAKYADTIRLIFMPLPYLRQRADERFSELRSRVDLVLGVHIRHGDYRKHRGGDLFFSPRQYRSWMVGFAKALPEVKVGFAICSDAKQKAKDFIGLDIIFGPGNDEASDYGNKRTAFVKDTSIEDNYLLSQCDYILGTVSTFCSWAAFWGGKPLLQVCSKDEYVTPDRFAIPIGPD